MTSLLGKTEQTLCGTRTPPTLGMAMSGATVQLAAAAVCWAQLTPAGICLSSLSGCLADAWASQVALTLMLSLALWLFSLRTIPTTGTSDPSIVDRLWSVLPALYSCHFYLRTPPGSSGHSRALLMAGLSTAWGVRLTWNFAKKGGFSGGEDYRWAEVRTWFPGLKWEAFNLVFICLFQQTVLLACASPAAAAMRSGVPLGLVDAAAAALFAAHLLGEAVADEQMWRFQSEKYRRKRQQQPLGPYARGFIETGMWAYSRHPNYYCEVMIWWSYYLFSVAATGQLLNWTILGAIFLTLLFVVPRGSLDVTEALSSRKYPHYPEYQRRVARFFPWIPKKD